MGLGNIALNALKLYFGAKATSAALSAIFGEDRSYSVGHVGVIPAKSRTKAGGMTLTTYKVRNLDERMKYIIRMTRQGREDPRIRKATAKILSRKCGDRWCLPEKDWDGEVRAIFNFVKAKVRYTRDIQGKDTYQHPMRTLEMGIADCLPGSTLLLTDKFDLVRLDSIELGTKIWGLNDWTEVANVWYKGELEVDAIKLNNGSWFKATPDHHVFVARCDKHQTVKNPCCCPIDERTETRITVAELKEDDVILSPKRISFGVDTLDRDLAFIEGLYIADGFSNHNSDFAISGQDGCPKEAQKRKVKEICDRLGISTTWHRKYVTVLDAAWALRMHRMGRYAPEKHVLDLNLAEAGAAGLLRGIMADSGANTNGNGRTFTTTSRVLMLQTRLLWKMFGVTCSERYIENHGGLGKNPIWRLGIRDQNRSDGKAEKLLRVKAIERSIGTEAVWDLTTEDHYVYLPECDATVSQCDDYSSLLGAMLLSAGYPVKFRVIRTNDSREWNHIFVIVGIPTKNNIAGAGNQLKWSALDASVPKPAGWSPPQEMIAATRDYDVK